MTWPPTSTVCPAAPDNLPVSAILPSLTATSPRNAGIPEPSTMRPFLISRSYAIVFPPRVDAVQPFAAPTIAWRRNVADFSQPGARGFAMRTCSVLSLDEAEAALDAIEPVAEAIDSKRHACVVGFEDGD